MILGIVTLVVGLVVLAKAADQFVEGAAKVAYHFNLSTVVVGAVVIGFGTSAPEMLVSGIAAAQGDVDIAIGNVAGSNIANVTLVLGVAAILGTIPIGRGILMREGPISFASVALFALLVQSGITRPEAVLLFVALVVAVGAAVLSARQVETDRTDQSKIAIKPELARTAVGLVFTVAGAQLLVFGAMRVATELDITGGFVGLTIVAVGTSLPELVTAAAASRKGEPGLVVGNLLGSNVFNSLAVGSLIGFISPGIVNDTALTGTPMWMMVGVAAAIIVLFATGRRVVRVEGVFLVLAFFAFLPFLPR